MKVTESVRIEDKTKIALGKVGAELQLKDGKARSYSETIDFLLDFYHQRKED